MCLLGHVIPSAPVLGNPSLTTVLLNLTPQSWHGWQPIIQLSPIYNSMPTVLSRGLSHDSIATNIKPVLMIWRYVYADCLRGLDTHCVSHWRLFWVSNFGPDPIYSVLWSSILVEHKAAQHELLRAAVNIERSFPHKDSYKNTYDMTWW